MIKKYILFLFLLGGTLVSLPFVNALEPSLQVTTTLTPSTIVPGNDGYVQLTITNVGTAYANKVVVKLISLDSPLVARTYFSTYGLGGLGIGKSVSTLFRFSVPSDTASGFYTAQFSTETYDGSVCRKTTQHVIITVQAPSSLEIISVNPNSFKIGEKTTLNFTLINTGDIAINNVIISWENPAIFPLGSSDRIFIQTIDAKQTLKVPVQAVVDPSTTSGVYSFSIIIEYTDQTGTKQTVNSTVGITVAGEYSFLVGIEKTENLYSGEKGEITISITNKGTGTAEFLTVKSIFGLEVVKEIYIGDLESDDYDTASFDLDLKNIKPGKYSLNINITYKDSYNQKFSEEKVIEFNITQRPLEIPLTVKIILILFILAVVYWKRSWLIGLFKKK